MAASRLSMQPAPCGGRGPQPHTVCYNSNYEMGFYEEYTSEGTGVDSHANSAAIPLLEDLAGAYPSY